MRYTTAGAAYVQVTYTHSAGASLKKVFAMSFINKK